MPSKGNGRAPLTKDQLADRTRFQWREQEVELDELGGYVVLVALSVEAREALPDLVDKDGVPVLTSENLAAVLAAACKEPKLTADEAKEFVSDWPASAIDKVITAFGDLNGTREEQSAAAGTFPAGE